MMLEKNGTNQFGTKKFIVLGIVPERGDLLEAKRTAKETCLGITTVILETLWNGGTRVRESGEELR